LRSQTARFFLAAAAGAGLLACKTPYHKEGATPEDFDRAKYACFAEARAGTWGYGFPRDQILFEQCMESRGWVKNSTSSAGEAP
jgi:hypothetical protein